MTTRPATSPQWTRSLLLLAVGAGAPGCFLGESSAPKEDTVAKVEEDDEVEDLDGDGDGDSSEIDCDDSDPAIHSGAEEVCDGLDNNCDGQVDEGLERLPWLPDGDGDGYGDDAGAVEDCAQPDGMVAVGGDCDDSDPAVNPGVVDDTCDEVDDNCDGALNDALRMIGRGQEFATIEDALSRARDGDTLCARDGETFEESVEIDDLSIRLLSTGRSTLKRDGRSGAGAVITIENVSGDVEVSGFTIKGGYADDSATSYGTDGGGILINLSSGVTLSDLTLQDNYASAYGGGLAIFDSSDILLDTITVQDNSAGSKGGGIYLRGATEVVGANLAVRRNSSEYYGGGLFIGTDAEMTMTLSEVTENTAKSTFCCAGGGLHLYAATLDMRQSVIAGNVSLSDGGGMHAIGSSKVSLENVLVIGNSSEVVGGLSGGTFTLQNVDVSGNYGATGCGGLWTNAEAEVVNSIFSGNRTGSSLSDVFCVDSLDATYTNLWCGSTSLSTCFEDTTPSFSSSDKVTTVDPEYSSTVDGSARSAWATWDLHLDASSPLLNAGDSSLKDPDGGRSSLGAYGGPDGDWEL